MFFEAARWRRAWRSVETRGHMRPPTREKRWRDQGRRSEAEARVSYCEGLEQARSAAFPYAYRSPYMCYIHQTQGAR